MAIYWHGTDEEAHQPHEGMCLTPCRESAQRYGHVIYSCELDPAMLNVATHLVADRDNCEYPGDRVAERSALISAGYDALQYADEDPHGREHVTLRLLSDHSIAMAAVTWYQV